MPVKNLVQHFGAMADPRCGGRIEHRLTAILVIAVCAVIACAESWDDIALYGRSKLDWLRTFLELPNGIPSHDTFRRVFMLIEPAGLCLPERNALAPKSSRHSAGDGGFSFGDSDIENISGFRAVERNLLIIGHGTIATSPAARPSEDGNTEPNRRSGWRAA